VSAGRDAEQVAVAVAEVTERVFATVAAVHAAALRPGARARSAAGERVLDDDVSDLLLDPEQLAVGLGLVVAPRAGRPLRLEWWQLDPDGGRLRSLEPDLRPSSMGYYDYTATEWFDVPRRTGRRHVVGPYVDVHGTGRYLLTLTEPVVVDGEFAGVVGADVPVRRFETHLLRVLGAAPGSFVLLNDEDRVVLSTAPHWLVGELVSADGLPPGPATPVAGTPWRLLLVAPRSVLTV
jgi:hypothetical protein